jgi:nitrous oxidase accessory protein NosD
MRRNPAREGGGYDVPVPVPRRLIAALVAVSTLLALSACAPGGDDSTSSGSDLVRVPDDASTIGEAVDRVAPGGLVIVGAGVYEEQIVIDKPDVTLRGAARNDTVIDGGGVRPFGVVSIADGVRVENLTVTGATFYGVLFTGLHDENGPSAPTVDGYEKWDPEKFPPLQRFLVDHVTAYDNGLYGIYAFNSQNGVIRDSYASGSADSGFYVGQCRNCGILVTGNVGERSAVGFENANASDSVVITGNRFSGNRIGMTLLSSYQEAFTPQRSNTVVGNVIVDNAGEQTPAQADGAFATGVGISGGVDNLLQRNLISGHARAGVLLSNTEDLPTRGTRLLDNSFTGNGVDVANLSASRTPAAGNCAADGLTTAPADLAAQLSAACAGGTDPQAATTELSGPTAPPGLSYLRVPAPRAQPDLPQRSSYPRLPDTVDMPDVASIPLPDAQLLAEWTGIR